ncbi:MAG: hypothetical protein J3K34DRAFT_519240 [Monoraphidium minutum]|nr:MAG: hypothetical protein J3K34DRAFT_519240 [Monoraphidium minutum]
MASRMVSGPIRAAAPPPLAVALVVALLLACGAAPARGQGTIGGSSSIYALHLTGKLCAEGVTAFAGSQFADPYVCYDQCKTNHFPAATSLPVFFSVINATEEFFCRCSEACAAPGDSNGTTVYQVNECSACTTPPNTTVVTACNALTSSDTVCGVGGGGGEDPHLQGFFGHRYSFCDHGAPCMGRAFSMLSAVAHALNTRVTRMAGPDRWPWAGTWITGLGFLFANVLSVELELATDAQYAVKPDGRGPGTTTAEVPRDWAGVFATLRVNGEDAAARIGSSDTVRAGDASVHFPAARHQGDATDGPVLVVTTPSMQVTFYLESEDVTHLDFAVTLLNGAAASEPMHGLLGQSLAWVADAPAVIEGAELEYAVEGGLLGTAFKYGAFTGVRRRAPKTARRNPMHHAAAAGPLTGGSVLGLAA